MKEIRQVIANEKPVLVATVIMVAGVAFADTPLRIASGIVLAAVFVIALIFIEREKNTSKAALDDLTEVIQQRLNDIDEQKTVRDTLLVTSQYGVELQDLLWKVLPQLPPDVKREYVDKTLAARSVYLELHPAGEVDPKAMWEIRRALLEPPKPPEGFQM